MGLIYKYLKAVLWGAEEKSQTEENQGFGKDVEAWKEKEKKHRQDLADGLLEELKKKFEDTKTDLKKKNDSEKEKCEKKEKWGKRWWCKATAFIAYGVELTIAYVIHRLKLTPRLIVYSLTIVIAWLLIWGFFLVHSAFKIIFPFFLLVVFVSLIFWIAWQVYLNYDCLIDFIGQDKFEIGIFIIHRDEFNIGISILSAIGSVTGLWKLSLIQILEKHINGLVDGFKKVLMLPKIEIRKGLKQTGKALKDAIGSIIGLNGLLLLLGAALLAVVVAASKVAMGDTIVHNNIYVNIEIGKSVPKSPSGNGGDKPITTWMTFPSEAKAIDWVNEKYEEDCLDSRASKNDDNQDSQNGDPDPCAVKPNKEDLAKSGFLPILKKLSAYENPDNKVELKILGFSSSSGLLSLKGNKRLKEKVEKKVKEGGKESCYERTNSNQTNVDENLRLSNAFNLCMAELRAWNVAKMLKEIIDSDETIPDHIKVIPHKWGSYSEMCRHRGFCDTKKEGGTRCYDTDLGSKNRRAEVCAIKIPGCPNFPPANRTHPSKVKVQISPEPQGETCDQCTSPVPVPCDRL